MKIIKILILSICGLIFFSDASFAFVKRIPFELQINSYDEFKLEATLDIPDYASVDNKAPLVIFIHSICRSRIAWDDFPIQVKKSLNVATLNLDLRGHGKSLLNKKNKKVYQQNMGMADYKKMPEDILAILDFIKNEYPEIDIQKTAIIGASLGASAGLMAASYNDKNIKTVIMLSPMLEYKGFDLRLPIVKYGKHPLLFIVSKKDKYPFDSSQELIKFAQGAKELKIYPFGGHGENLLKFQPDSKQVIIKWLEVHFTKGKIKIKNEKQSKKPKVKYKEIKEYSGKIKEGRSIHRELH